MTWNFGLGLGLGGLMWSRPDGFIFAGALLAGFGLFVWSSRTAEEWRDVARWLGNSAVIAAVIYVPWFLEAWLYYGSPRVFDVRARLNQYKSLPGAPYAYNDAVFAVYRRRE